MKRIVPLLLCLALLTAGCTSDRTPVEDSSSSSSPSTSSPADDGSSASSSSEQQAPAISLPATPQAAAPLTVDTALRSVATLSLGGTQATLRLGATYALAFENYNGLPELPSANRGIIWVDFSTDSLAGQLVFPQKAGDVTGPTISFTAQGTELTQWTVENDTATPLAVTAEGKMELVRLFRDYFQEQVPKALGNTPGFPDFYAVASFQQRNDGSFSDGYEPALTLHANGHFTMKVNGLSYMAELTGEWRQSPHRVELYDLESDTLEGLSGQTLVFTILSDDQLAYCPQANRFGADYLNLGATFDDSIFVRQP